MRVVFSGGLGRASLPYFEAIMNEYSFNIVWSEDDGEYVATCPSFPGLSAFGTTKEKALEEGKIALGLFIETYQEHGIPLPESK